MRSRCSHRSWADRLLASALWLSCCVLACGDAEFARDASAALDGGLLDPATLDAVSPSADRQIDAAKPPSAVERYLYIVAHEDDDLGQMTPDLTGRVVSGQPLRTIYLTSGDAGLDCAEYVADREQGVKVGYAMMAGVANAWDDSEQEVLGKIMRVSRLRGTQVELAFLGFHNSGYDLETPDLECLWSGEKQSVVTRTLDGRSRSDTYTRTDLIAVLRQIMLDWAPTHIQTLDSGRLEPLIYPFDHSDHVHSALFALAATLQYDRPYNLSMYRTYNDMFEQPNVSAQQAQYRQQVFDAYLAHDPKVCGTGLTVLCGNVTTCDPPDFYTDFTRQYRTVVYENFSGLVRGPYASCLTGDGQDGSVTLTPCASDNPAQQFKVDAGGAITHIASGLCLDAGTSERGSALTLALCVDRLQQRFLLTTQAQLRGPDATCVANELGSAVLRECTLDPGQLNWLPGMYPSFVTANIAGPVDWEIPDAIVYYGTLSFGDVEGDGDDDVCVRRDDGVYCALAQGAAAFSSFTRVLDGFRDDQGWAAPAYGTTVQLGDIDGDGSDELCGRGPDGVWCADWNAATTSFDPPQRRSTDFGDDQGYSTDASRYRSLRIVDLDGDRMGELCARSDQGIRCARSTGGSYAPAQVWTSEQFTDALGWASQEYGSTLRYGDVDGDGDADVCGRTVNGILCARNNGAGRFVDPHVWSYTGDFSDANGWNAQLSYYGSIRLADIDGDGNFDVCGRGPQGLLCSVSTGTSFSIATSLGSADAFSDGKGWQPDRYGSTVGLMDLNLDGFDDLCAWGPGYDGKVGLNCALADSRD